MASHSSIEWTDATWQPITGCSVVSPGCTNCYAMRLAGTRLQHHPSRANLTTMTKAGPVWNGAVRFNREWLTQPLGWKKPRRIFVCAHGDLFHEAVPDEWIDQVFAVMALAPQHTFQILTKRPERMRAYLSANGVVRRWAERGEIGIRVAATAAESFNNACRIMDAGWPLPNVWLGVSAEDQRRADERIPHLLATPAAVRFVSAEPLLGPIDFTDINGQVPEYGTVKAHGTDTLTPHNRILRPQLDWIIVGGESGTGARPMHPDWARSIRDQCAAAGVPFFFKQWGSWYPIIDRDNEDPDWRADYSRTNHAPEKFRILNLEGGCGFHGERVHLMQRYSKSRAGRLLDGVEHSAMPGRG